MSEKIVKGFRLSNLDDSFVLSSKNDSLVESISEQLSSLIEEFRVLNSKYDSLKEEVDNLKYNQEEHSSSSDNSSNNDTIHGTTEPVNGGVDEGRN